MHAQAPKKNRAGGQSDLTEGSTAKTILLFSLPIFLSYVLQNLYSVADAAICGHVLGAHEVAGVNDTGSISFLFLQFALGCTSGMSVLLARKAGEHDADGLRKAFAMQILLGVFLVIVVTAISLCTIRPLLGMLGVRNSSDPVESAVYRAAFTYITIICAGMAGQYFYNLICCVLRSIGDSKTPLLFLGLSALLNILLDLLFMAVFGWGVAGAAVATVASQALSAVACFIFTFVRYPQLRLHTADFKAFTFRGAGYALWQGVPLGLQFSVLAFGIVIMSRGVISFDALPDGGMKDGTPAQIGYSAACKLGALFTTPFSALGTAMLSFCGQNNGAGKYDRIKRGTTQAMGISFLLSLLVLGAGFLLCIGGAYQHIFLAADKITPESIRFGNLYLFTALPFYFFLGGIFVLRNVVQGLSKPLCPFLAGIAELIARIAVCLLLPPLLNGGAVTCLASNAAFVGLSLGDPVAWIAADIPLTVAAVRHVYRRKK